MSEDELGYLNHFNEVKPQQKIRYINYVSKIVAIPSVLCILIENAH